MGVAGRRVCLLAVVLAAGLAASSANASWATNGTVSGIEPLSPQGASNVMFFVQNGTRSTSPAPPACATNQRWVINLNSPSGQAMASTVLTAYSLGKPVMIQGTGACADWPDSESILYVYMP